MAPCEVKKRPTYKVVDGFRLPVSFPSEDLVSAQHYQPLDDDIFIVTYPKCGTTWMMNILLMLRTKGVYPENFVMDDYIPHIEEVGARGIQKLKSPRIIKSHFPFDRLPWNDKSKYIFVCRNPFDCVVSYYYHTQGFPQHYDFKDGTFDDFFELFVSGEVDFNDYFDHLNSLYNQRERDNVLFLTYEEMKEDIHAVMLRLVTFLGGEFQENCQEKGVLEKVIEVTSFSSMKKMESSFHSGRGEGCTQFIRKGIVGDYRTMLSEEQEKRLTERFKEKSPNVIKLWSKYGIPSK